MKCPERNHCYLTVGDCELQFDQYLKYFGVGCTVYILTGVR